MFEFALIGKQLSSVKIDLTKPNYDRGGDETYAQWVLNDAFITSFKTVSGGERPQDEYTFGFSEITYNWWKMNRDDSLGGKVTYTWQLSSGQMSSLMEGDVTGFAFEFGSAPVPEASSLLMLGAAGTGLLLRRRG
jgi:hypothetical protein